MAIERVEQLRVYQTAFEVAMHLFEHSKTWPEEERYALTDQVRRSSRAVCANLSEAWAKRLYPKHFVSKLSDVHGEAAETLPWIAFATEYGSLTRDEARPLSASCRHVIGGVVRMMNQTDRWCGPSALVREEEIAYDAKT